MMETIRMVELFEYIITYHMGPMQEDVEITLYAKDYEDAVSSAKKFRQDAFSVRRAGK